MMTRTKALNLMIAVLLILTLVPGATFGYAVGESIEPQDGPTIATPTPDRAQVTAALQSAPLTFIQNVGQFDPRARFQVRGQDGTLWLAEESLWITVMEQGSRGAEEQGSSPLHLRASAPQPRKGVNLKLSFVGANPHPRLEPFNRLETSVNYFLGDDPAQWRANVPAWGGVRYVDLYPGVDLEITGEGGRWTWRLTNLQPPISNIQYPVRLRVEGTDDLALDGDRLRLTTAIGDLTLPLLTVAGGATPGGSRAEISHPEPGAFEVSSPLSAPLLLRSSAPLPPRSSAQTQDNPADLLYSTFVGGSDYDHGQALALDGAGNAVITGDTWSSDFPTTAGAFDTTFGGGYSDVFVLKLATDGGSLLYSTFVGGTGLGYDWGMDLALDNGGNIVVTGITASSDFPTTSEAYDTSYNGGDMDIFILKLAADDGSLVYSTFVGGGDYDQVRALVLDEAGNAIVTGSTRSRDFPTTAGAYDTGYNDGLWDIVVFKLAADGDSLVYSTFVGGSSLDIANALALDNAGNVVVTGETESWNFPITAGAYDTSHNGLYDACVFRLSANGSSLLYSTFVGGSSSEYSIGLTLDETNHAVVTGSTASVDFPTTAEAYDTSYNGGDWDAFVFKLAADHSSLLYGTFVGGSDEDWGIGLRLNDAGNVIVTGDTKSSDFPTTTWAYDSSFNGGDWDAFVCVLAKAGGSLSYSTFVGGSGMEWTYGLATDGNGNAAFTGQTSSSDFPITSGAFDSSHNGETDIFFLRLAIGDGPEPIDPGQDSDGDGLTDYDETHGWYNGHDDAPFFTDPHDPDTDDDGLSDGIEKRANTHPNLADTDNDGYTDGVEDANHNGIVDIYESDPKNWDSDGDGIEDSDDPVHVKLYNRKALVIWLTEFQNGAPTLGSPWLTSDPEHIFKTLGFDTTMKLDKQEDGQYFTYDQIDGWIHEFADELNGNDVAIVLIASHGSEFLGRYSITYGDGKCPEAQWLFWGKKNLKKQLGQIGPGLDFLWLRTCHSWHFWDRVDELNADGIIFYGATDEADQHFPIIGFYETIAGATRPENITQDPWSDGDCFDAETAVRNIEDTLPGVNAASPLPVWEKYDNRAGNMDLLDFYLSPGAPNSLAGTNQLGDVSTVTPTLSLASVSYLSYDSNADGLDDGLEIGWVADTTLAQEEALAEVFVYDEAGKLQQRCLVGPYTVTNGAFQTVTVNFLSPISQTYEAAIELYGRPHVLSGLARSDEVGLHSGPGRADGDEAFVSTAVSHGDVLTVSFSISTTAVTETVAVVGTLATDRQTLDSVAATVRSPDYLVTNAAPVSGRLSFTPPMTGVYYVNLYLVDQNNYVEDVAQIHPWSTGVYTESVLDANGNGQYDELVVEVGLAPPQAGDYILTGRLYDSNWNHVADASTAGYLPETGASLPITFTGTTIRQSRLDGPYQLHELSFHRVNDSAYDFLSNAHQTSAYNYADFEIESALLNENYRDYLIDDDGDGYAEALNVEVGLTCAAPNTYTLEAYLYDVNGVEIGRVATSTLLPLGESIVDLAFNSQPIQSNGVDGPYTLGNLTLRDTEGEVVDQLDSAYQTTAYYAAQFQVPGALLTGSYADYGLDTDGDGLYNYLAIEVGVAVSKTGEYQLDGMITGTVPYTFPWANTVFSLPAGVQTVTLGFDGRNIRDSQVEGKFHLAHLSLFERPGGLSLDSGNNLFTTTQVYTHTQFQRSLMYVYLPLILRSR